MIRVKKMITLVKGIQIIYNETTRYDENGEEIYDRDLEMLNDIKCFEEYELVTGERLLKDSDYTDGYDRELLF